MMLSLPSLRRGVFLASAALLISAPANAAAPAAYEVDPSVTITLETKEGPAPSGPLDAAPFTYTVRTAKKCEAPYDDGSRAVLTQAAAPTRVVLSAVEDVEADGSSAISMDATLADFAQPGSAVLTVECVRITNGIAESAPTPFSQALTITDTEWKIVGITKAPEPEQTATPTATPTPTPTATASTQAPPVTTVTTSPDATGPSSRTSPTAPPTASATPRVTAPATPAPTATEQAVTARPQGFLPRTGAEVVGLLVLAGGFTAGGAALIRARSTRR